MDNDGLSGTLTNKYAFTMLAGAGIGAKSLDGKRKTGGYIDFGVAAEGKQLVYQD
jgi:hypothetical protein